MPFSCINFQVDLQKRRARTGDMHKIKQKKLVVSHWSKWKQRPINNIIISSCICIHLCMYMHVYRKCVCNDAMIHCCCKCHIAGTLVIISTNVRHLIQCHPGSPSQTCCRSVFCPCNLIMDPNVAALPLVFLNSWLVGVRAMPRTCYKWLDSSSPSYR
jgi:hypothetical protein